jgi:hypothetical protein
LTRGRGELNPGWRSTDREAGGEAVAVHAAERRSCDGLHGEGSKEATEQNRAPDQRLLGGRIRRGTVL